MNRLLFLSASLALLLLAGCAPKVSHRELLEGISKEVITVLYQEAATQASQLAVSAEDYQNNPSPQNLATLGVKWKEAAIAWQRTEPFRLGPATDLWLSNKIGYQNIRPATVDANVAKIGTPAEVKLSAVGASGKGLFAMGYLLFQSGGSPKIPSAKGCRYLTLAGRDAAGLTQQLVEAWIPSGKDYSKTFIAGGQDSLNKMTNGIIESIERLKEKRIARLLGREAVWGDDTETPSKTDPAMILDGEILAAPLQGIDRLFQSEGKNGPSLLTVYIRQTGSSAEADFLAQLKHCILLTKALPTPLNSPTTRPVLEADYAEIKKLVGISKSSLISALGVTLTFNSNDGD